VAPKSGYGRCHGDDPHLRSRRARDLPGLLAKVREGAEVIIEDGNFPPAILRSTVPAPRNPSESNEIAEELRQETGDAPESRRIGFMKGRGSIGPEFFNFFAVQGFQAGADHLAGVFVQARLHALLDALTQWAKVNGDEIGCSRHGHLACHRFTPV
jgi:hypothetical protein